MSEDENLLIILCKFINENQINELKSFMELNLSYHFIPNRILSLRSNIPLNVNGKIDRTKLHALYLNTIQDSPKNTLVCIWQVRKYLHHYVYDLL